MYMVATWDWSVGEVRGVSSLAWWSRLEREAREARRIWKLEKRILFCLLAPSNGRIEPFAAEDENKNWKKWEGVKCRVLRSWSWCIARSLHHCRFCTICCALSSWHESSDESIHVYILYARTAMLTMPISLQCTYIHTIHELLLKLGEFLTETLPRVRFRFKLWC